MLDRPPTESARRSWAWVILCIGLIYATIPLARWLVETVNERIGREIFLYSCLLLFGLGGFYAWRNLRHRQLPRSAYLWLIAVLVVIAVTIFRLRAIPEEALHLVQYALLGVLVYRALSHRIRNYTIYPLSLLLTAMVGMVDEYIQWVVPSRHFDLRDIAINAFAGLLAQVGLVAGLRPKLIAQPPSERDWRRLGNWTVATLLLLLISFVNTPQRVAWYAKQIPGLAFLQDGNSMMAQYGYLHRSPVGGEFRSRFSVEALAALDRQRGAEMVRTFNQDPIESYAEFLKRYSIIRDPYVHEAGVHLFSRNYHLKRVRDSPATRLRHYLAAYHENEILRNYFPTALSASRFAWDASTSAEVSAAVGDSSEPYRSKVSRALITRVSEAQVWLLFGATIVLVLVASRVAGRRWAREVK